MDHFVLDEAEGTLSPFLNDLRAGKKAKHNYITKEFPEITHTPVPLWHLLEKKKYGNMSIQYSRGYPYNCEFCSIITLNGRRPGTKSTEQFLAELTAFYDYGWCGSIFVVDDNFIGNKRKLRNELLPILIEWSKQHHYPFNFGTETFINLADDDQLVKLMAEAGFNHTFIGIETPNDESLAECGKTQNLKRDILTSIKKLHKSGLRVSGGFIIDFEHDPSDIFEQQIRFIRNGGIVTAMVGLLNAPAGTRLFERLKKKNRLLNNTSGNNMDGSINFIPKMNCQTLITGYKKVLKTIYSPKEYYERVKTFLKEYQLEIKNPVKISFNEIKALLKSLWILGVREKGKRYYWKLFSRVCLSIPKNSLSQLRWRFTDFIFARL